MRRAAPVILIAAIGVLLGWYVVYSRGVVQSLQREAALESVMYARIWQALADTTEAASAAALLDLSGHIHEKGVPVVIIGLDGALTQHANLPFDPNDSPGRLPAYLAKLDAQNPPVQVEGVGTVHFGNTLLVQGLRVVPLVQAGLILLVGLAALYAIRARARAERERTWAGMAREAAHQLGTPLSSLSGWMQLLEERRDDPLVAGALSHVHGDLDRLERVAHRFERIGNPPKVEPVDVGALTGRVAKYFAVRAPKLDKAVAIQYTAPEQPVRVAGDAVLLEWALEAVLKNALDALAGRGGRVELEAEALPEGGAIVRVKDDGPGVPRENRKQIFEAGFSTKEHGWGIGLSLARRIVEENHRGKLQLVPAERGATFEIILP